jgi:hypothetical protein
MKKELREIIEAKVKIISENKDSDVMNVSVPFIQADEKNQNGRSYPKALLQREIARVQNSVKKGSFIGTGDHPSSGLEDIETASHIVTALSLDEKGQGTAELRILPTERGKTIQTLIRNNATLGVSIRGFGTVGKDGRVSDDYKLAGLDIVMNSSFKNAVFDKSNIFESVNFEGNKEEEMKEKLLGLSSEDIEEMIEDVYHIYLTEGNFRGDLEDFKKEHGNAVLAVLLVEEQKFKTTEEALKHLSKFEKSEKTVVKKSEKISEKIVVEELTEEAIQARTWGFFLEAQKGGFRGDLNAWKKEFPKLVETASESIKIVEKKKETKEPFKAKLLWTEILAGGFVGTIAEYRKQFPDVELVLPVPRQKVIAEKETLEEQTKRVFETLKADNPSSSTTLEDVKRVLKDEYESKREKKIREWAIRRVNASLGYGAIASQAQLEKMVEEEIVVIMEEKAERKRKNWQCYKKLLSD